MQQCTRFSSKARASVRVVFAQAVHQLVGDDAPRVGQRGETRKPFFFGVATGRVGPMSKPPEIRNDVVGY